MPGFMTHYLFGVETYKKIENWEMKREITENRGAFGLGLQGPDLFFYYIPSYFLHPENVGNTAHRGETGRFFENLLRAREHFEYDTEKLAIADAYLLGFIGHYTLDTHTHPFIYAHTKFDAVNEPSTKEYFGQHAYLETELDIEILRRDKAMIPSKMWMNRTIRLTRQQRQVISYLLSFAYRETYDMKVTKRQVKNAAHWMYGICKLMNDPHGWKKRFVRKIEDIFVGKALVSAMIPSDRYKIIKDPMNLEHKRWKHPWTGEVYIASFEELMQEAVDHFLLRIRCFERSREAEKTDEFWLEFLNEYGNLSFSKGI